MTTLGRIYGDPFRYNTSDLLGHFCIPNGDDYVNQATQEAFLSSFFGASYGSSSSQNFYDVGRSWPVILISTLFTVFIGYSYLFVIRRLGGAIVWVSFGVTAVIVFSGAFYTYFYARKSYDPKNPTYSYLASLAFILWALTALIILCAVICRH
jgi:hypothetical protein